MAERCPICKIETDHKLSCPERKDGQMRFSTNLMPRSPSPSPLAELTKADTVALWHAVTALNYQGRAMPGIDGITPEMIEAERARLLAAKRALRKVNAIRKAAHG